LFARANEELRVFQPTRDDVTPWHRACADAGPAAGFPFIDNLNDLNAELGIGFGALNVAQHVRWNSAFGYLDPVRNRPNLQIVGNVLVDRVVIGRNRATGVEAIIGGERRRIEAERIVLCGGAYGSPLVLLRSGIGAAQEIEPHGISVTHELPGVGRNLQDHPSSRVVFAGTPALVEEMNAFVDGGGAPREEGSIVLARSSRCAAGFDLHLYPIGSRLPDGGWRFAIFAAVMEVRSTGSVRLSNSDPAALPIIDTGYFSDPDGIDLAVLVEGVQLARRLAAHSPLKELCGPEVEPLLGEDRLPDHIVATGLHDYHPTSTCKMGPATDPSAVVDHRGRVHGMDGLYVADASIMPFVTRANTNIPTAVVGEKFAESLLNDS
jgi:choline dehydrogenase